MKKIKYIIFFAITLLLSINKVFALDNGYKIESYNVDIQVNENNVLDITETIDVNFLESRHGIFRKIPINNTVKRSDGSYENNHAKISKIKVNEKYSTSIEVGYKKIKIGDANRTLIGNKKYVISYSYDLGKDRNKDYDELYFNIIGTEWDTSIDNVTFTIKMPNNFDEKQLGFSIGSYGNSGYDLADLYYEVNGNTITGQVNRMLYASEGVNVRLQLPNNYFKVEDRIDIFTILMFLIPILGVIMSIILWYLHGKDDEVIETIEFNPPVGFNSLDVGYAYKGRADSKDVVSLLIYLANKGYLTIEEFEDKILFTKKKSFKIAKLKDYDGDNYNEKRFFEGLFDLGYTKEGTTVVNESDLNNHFYTVVNSILMNKNNSKNRKELYQSTGKYSLLVVGLILTTLLLIILKPLQEYFGTFNFNLEYIIDSLSYNKYCLIGFIIGIISIIVMIVMLILMPKRTEYGNQLLGKIRGFKNFLETAEKDRLETMVKEDPKYFYNILPFAYVLGVSNTWIKKFESIALEPPNWYCSNDPFDMYTFNRFMDRTMTSAVHSMTSSPSSDSSSGGGFSGGGFSGGGSGGGGGGSW